MDTFNTPYDEKEYDPSDSRKLAEWSPGGFRNHVEILYITAKGNYFILAEEGLLSRHMQSRDDDTWFGGTFIKPITPEEAYAWCEETGNYEVMDGPLFPLKRVI